MMSSSDSNMRARRPKAMPANARLDPPVKRQTAKKKSVKASSFHGVASVVERDQDRSHLPRISRSFQLPRDRSDRSDCSYVIPFNVRLKGKEDGCPKKCAIEVMKIASKALERRAAELEIERQEIEEERARMRPKMQVQKDRQLMSTSFEEEGEVRREGAGTSYSANQRHSVEEDAKTLTDTDGSATTRDAGDDASFFEERRTRNSVRGKNNRPKSFTAPPTHSEAYDEKKQRNTFNTFHASMPDVGISSQPMPEQNTQRKPSAKNNGGAQSGLGCRFSLDQVAQPHQIDEASNSTERLINIARLREGDGVWIWRSRGVWTYATLKARKNGRDAHLVFFVNSKGSTKKFPVTQWAEHVRMVAKNIDQSDTMHEEERDIDLVMSDLQLSEACSVNQALLTKKRTTRKGRKEALADSSDSGQQRSRPFLASMAKPRAVSVATDQSKSFSSSENILHTESWDNDVALDTLGVQDNSSRAVSDHEVSMFTLGLEEELEESEESEGALPPVLNPALNRGRAPGGKKKKLSVSWNVPKDPGQSAAGSSLPSTPPESSFRTTCAEESRIRDASVSLQRLLIGEQHGEQPEPPKRPLRRSRRPSWDDFVQVIEEVQVDRDKRITVQPKTKAATVQSKKLNDLNMGRAIPKHHRQIKQESFYSALKSINKRSSVMMPPTSRVSVHLG